jgi:uncharacterized protein (TIGR00255 family)
VIFSMTGYGTAARELPHGALSLEIKGVNSRFLDTVFRLNDELRALEPQLREMVAAAVTRGKVEVRLGYGREATRAVRPLAINAEMVARLGQAAAEVRRMVADAAPLTTREILDWPGVLEDASLPQETLRATTMELARLALAEYQASREREGAKLATMLEERVAAITEWVKKIEPLLPGIVADHQARVAARLREALGLADDERVRQEVAMFGIRIDVAEELSRLAAHLGEVRRVLARGGACGKRLDFLMQELHREANTLGSKSVSTEVSAGAMEIKILIEQMREQVQNIE